MSHITANVTLLPAGHNVRKGPLVGRSLGCEVVIDGNLYPIRFELQPGKTIALGTSAVLEGTLDQPEEVLQLLSVGKKITLWERGAIGEAVVLEIRADG